MATQGHQVLIPGTCVTLEGKRVFADVIKLGPSLLSSGLFKKALSSVTGVLRRERHGDGTFTRGEARAKDKVGETAAVWPRERMLAATRH